MKKLQIIVYPREKWISEGKRGEEFWKRGEVLGKTRWEWQGKCWI